MVGWVKNREQESIFLPIFVPRETFLILLSWGARRGKGVLPRLRRETIKGDPYHVYNRFSRRETVFGGPEEPICLVDRIHVVKVRDGFNVPAWRFRSNHFHLGGSNLGCAFVASDVPLAKRLQPSVQPEQFIALACECLGGELFRHRQPSA